MIQGQNSVRILTLIIISGYFVNVPICWQFYFALDIRLPACFVSKDIKNLPLVG